MNQKESLDHNFSKTKAGLKRMSQTRFSVWKNKRRFN